MHEALKRQIEAAFRALAEFWRDEIGSPPILPQHAEAILRRWVAGEVPFIVFSEDGTAIEDIACAGRISSERTIAVMATHGSPDAMQCRALHDVIIGSVEEAGGTWPLVFPAR
jgi:hypothetical protein